jgi:hypothetical protein
VASNDEPLPVKVRLTLYRGDTRVWQDTFRFAPESPDEVGEPVNLTGYEFIAQIRATPDTTEVMATIDVVVTDPAAGLIKRTLTAEESAKLAVGTAYWDLQATTSSGEVRTFMAGAVKVLGDVSRDV